MKYYVKYTIGMQAKNKAWASMQEYAGDMDGTIIHECKLSLFIQMIERNVSVINSHFPRCTDLKLVIVDNTICQQVYTSVGEDVCFTLSFYPIKREFTL